MNLTILVPTTERKIRKTKEKNRKFFNDKKFS